MQSQQEIVTSLTKDTVKMMIELEPKDLKNKSFYLQVLNVKEFDTLPNDKKQVKIRLSLSDGISSVTAMMNNSIYGKMKEQLTNYSIIKVFSFLKQTVRDKNVLILSKTPEIIYKGLKLQIGHPQYYNDNLKAENFDRDYKLDIPKEILRQYHENVPNHNDDDVSMSQNTNDGENDQNSNQEQAKQVFSQKMDLQNLYTPIKALSTFNYDWRIKARVTQKYEIKHWKRSRSEGYLLNVELMDSYGTQIQATFFNDAVDKYNGVIREGNVYLFSNGQVKIANQKFTTVRNDFCIVFDKNADIIEVPDDESIQEKGFNFTTLKDIQMIDRTKAIDVIGVLHSVGQFSEIQLKNGTSKQKRTVLITDESCLTIQINLWAEQGYKFDHVEGNPVIAIKGAKVVEYNGKLLNVSEETFFIFNPPHPRTQELKSWYNRLENKELVLKSINRDLEKESKNFDNCRLVSEMNEQLGIYSNQTDNRTAQSEFFLINCYLSFIKNDEKTYYLACPEESCRRKVLEEAPQAYKCEQCNKTYNYCVPTYMLLAKVQDISDSIYVNFYREQGNQIMTVGADVLKKLKDEKDQQAINDIFFESTFKNYQILLKAKTNNFGDDQQRLNFFATKVMPHSFQLENEQLLKRLDVYRKIPEPQQ